MVNKVDGIWSKVEVLGTNDCWPFKGRVNWGKRGGGYGRLDVSGNKGVYAHRVAYLATNPGSISLDCKDGLFVLHSCDNPICCNPRHLYIGDHDKNMADKVERGRSKIWASSVVSPRARFTADQVREIRKKFKDGRTFNGLAEEYGVSRSCIDHIIYRLHYADVSD